MFESHYKEIAPYPDATDTWNVITLDAGASQSTLQDIKLPESSGCYMYEESGNISTETSNQFIYWRSSNDIIEFVEISFDSNLVRNKLKLRLKHTPILQGTSIHELSNQVIILIATVSTIHRLWFPHPNTLKTRNQIWRNSEVAVRSIFYDFEEKKSNEHHSYYVLNQASMGVPLPHTSCSWLKPDGDAAFVLANNSGSHLLFWPVRNMAKATYYELKTMSVMSRLWNGLIRTSQGRDVALSLVCHSTSSDTFIFSLCYDLHIRMWSQNRQDCLMISPVSDMPSESMACNFNAQQCCMKKSVGSSSSDFYLAVYVCSPRENKFHIFCPNFAEQYKLSHVATLNHEKLDLVDFCLSRYQIFSLWLNSHSEPIIDVNSIESDGRNVLRIVDWIPSQLQLPILPLTIDDIGEQDPRDIFLKEIFRQGRFSPNTLIKAINIYRRVADTSFINNSLATSDGSLREEVIKVVENEIYAKERASELAEEEMRNVQFDCWRNFFSYCIQYHEVGTKPLGLYLNPYTGYVILIKKNLYTLLYPCEEFEEAILSPLTIEHSAVVTNGIHLASSLTSLFECLNIIHGKIEEMSKTMQKHLNKQMSFEHRMLIRIVPEDTALEFAHDLMHLQENSEGNILALLQGKLEPALHIVTALKKILEQLDFSGKDYNYVEENAPDLEYSKFLSSDAGVSIICEGLTLMAKHRYFMCRDLLVLEMLLQDIGTTCGLTLDGIKALKFDIIPHTKLLVHAYYTLMWCTEYEFVPNESAFLESGFKQICLLDYPEVSASSRDTMGKTGIYYFIEEQGRKDAFSLLFRVSEENLCGKNWQELYPLLVNNIARLLWTLGPHFLFPEFLVTRGQYSQLQGYIHLLEPYCNWYPYSRLFLSAHSYLLVGEHAKSVELFVHVADGVDKEEYLHNKVIQGSDDTASSIAQYYMKIIRLYEHFGLSACIVELATAVIHVLNPNDLHIPIFWSLVFKHHLELGHSEQAFAAMTSNPDQSRQKDCLRQLLVVLCERKEFELLVEFSYVNLLDDVISILESRARTSDLLCQNFYDLLYAFHIHNSNFRKAASTMFEYGMRLGQEVNNLEGLQKQSYCYLVTINCLQLVDSKYAWIVKPPPKVQNLIDATTNENNGMSPKRNSDGEEIPPIEQFKRVEILETSDILREHELIHARLLLVQRDPSPTNMAARPLSAEDCIPLLVNAGLFDVAIKLCKSFSLRFNLIFDGLVNRCIKLMERPKGKCLRDEDQELYDCLVQNESSTVAYNSYISGQEQMWYLLQHYLDLLETEGKTVYHRSVATRLLSLGIEMPAWFRKKFQKLNAAELLRLYICYGCLENATDLCLEYIDAILGVGKEHFGLMYPLQASNPSVWLPHSYIDALLDMLENVQSEIHYYKLYQKLQEKINQYNDAVKSVSDSMIRIS